MNLFFGILNQGYVNFTLNFMKRWRDIGIQSDIIFACTDEASYWRLKENEIDCFLYRTKISNRFESWSTPNYKEIVFEKLDITREVLQTYKKKLTGRENLYQIQSS